MICCLNPDCDRPHNPDENRHCQNCGIPLVALLRHRYRIIQPLGRGGFGRTYLAEDTDKLNEPCVVKQLAYQGQGTWATQKAKQLFEQEAKQLQQLGEHSQIPTLFAYFQENEYLYLVQQCIDGQDLLKELRHEGPFNEAKIRSLLLDLLPVLKFIHDRHTIHRDLKPENIMRRRQDDRLMLIDFGVAKMLATTVVAFPKGTSLGSHGYAPIEQLKEGNATTASDLFSLGATCFHLLTNIPPFQLWVEQGYSWVTNWHQYLPQPLTSDLTNVLNKLLQKDVDQRYQSAEDVLNDLQLQSPIPVAQPPTSPVSQPSSSPIAQPSSSNSSQSPVVTAQTIPSGNSNSSSGNQPLSKPSVAATQRIDVKPAKSSGQLPLVAAIIALSTLAAAIVGAIVWFRSSPVGTSQVNSSPSPLAPSNSPSDTASASPSTTEESAASAEPLQVNSDILVASNLAQYNQTALDRRIRQGSIVYEAARKTFVGETWVQLKVCLLPPIDPLSGLNNTPKDLGWGELGWIDGERYRTAIDTNDLAIATTPAFSCARTVSPPP